MTDIKRPAQAAQNVCNTNCHQNSGDAASVPGSPSPLPRADASWFDPKSLARVIKTDIPAQPQKSSWAGRLFSGLVEDARTLLLRDSPVGFRKPQD